MVSVFDVITVTCFAGLVLSFFRFADHQVQTLAHFGLAGVVFAVANQVGNAGFYAFGTLLILAGISYAMVVLRH